MNKHLLKLKDEEASALKYTGEIIHVKKDFDIVDANQVPIVGIILLEGLAEFIDNNITIETASNSSLLGVKQLLLNGQSSYRCRIKKDSKIIVLGKSVILRAMREQDSVLSLILNKLDLNTGISGQGL